MTAPSVIDRAAGTAVVRIREAFYRRGRHFLPYGLHKGLVTLGLAEALQLVETKQAKMPAGHSLRELREAVGGG